MFCTTLRRRPSLSTLIPLLTSSTNPKLRETNLQTHDLALPTQPQSSHTTQQQQRPTTQSFLILTPSSLADPPSTQEERINRFSTLTASPTPTIAFLLSTSPTNRTDAESTYRFSELQTHIHALPTPPPLLPIPTPQHLLPILQTLTTSPAPPPPPPQAATLALLPHVTSKAPAKPLSTHSTNVLSDLCRSVREVAELGGREGGGEVLGEWLGEEGRGVAEFWEGEWIVE
ncbi:MAG: hypothetical protein Q9161_002216 [Pseudevernia consocians]